MGNVLRFSTEMDDKVSKKLTAISKSFDKLGGPGSGASLFGNVGAKIVAKGFSLIETAASDVVDVIGAALKADMELEASTTRLSTALKANIPGWDGQTTAIEGVIRARERLGFTDIEQRDSLSLLVAAGDSVSRGLLLEGTAMDLARLKNIDLSTAVLALTKVEDGHYRVLESLGIVLPKNATAQDAVNAVTKVAKGQAEAYAGTISGRVLAGQIAWNARLEDIGQKLMPIVLTGLNNLGMALDYIAGDPTLKGTKAMELLRSAIQGVGNIITWTIGRVGDLIGALSDLIDLAGKALDALGKIAPPGSGGVVGTGIFGTLTLPGHAAGGWVGMNGPELSVVGEQGPEYIRPAGTGTGDGAGVRLLGISRREIEQMISEGMYFQLQAASATIGRS